MSRAGANPRTASRSANTGWPALATTVPTPDGLQLRRQPVADCRCYDRLREAGH